MKRLLFMLCMSAALMVSTESAHAQGHPEMDVRWKIVANDESYIRMRMEIRTNQINETLRDANFALAYDSAVLAFGQSQNNIVKGNDYFWNEDYEPSDSVFTNITKMKANLLSINIHLESVKGIPVTTDTSYSTIVDLIFRKKQKNITTHLVWKMDMNSARTFDNVFDNEFNAYNAGDGWLDPYTLQL